MMHSGAPCQRVRRTGARGGDVRSGSEFGVQKPEPLELRARSAPFA